MLIFGQCLHCHLEFIHVSAIHVEEIRLQRQGESEGGRGREREGGREGGREEGREREGEEGREREGEGGREGWKTGVCIDRGIISSGNILFMSMHVLTVPQRPCRGSEND